MYHETTKRHAHLNLSLIGAISLKASLELLNHEIGMERVERHLRSLGAELGRQYKKLGVKVQGNEEVGKRAPHIYVLKLLHPDWATQSAEDRFLCHIIAVVFELHWNTVTIWMISMPWPHRWQED